MTGLLHGIVDRIRGSLLKMAQLCCSFGLVIQLLSLLELSMLLPVCIRQLVVLLPVRLVLVYCSFTLLSAGDHDEYSNEY